MTHVTICEVGPRDGLQMAKAIMPSAVKRRWIAALAAAGVPEIEVGSFVPPRLIPSMADTDEMVRAATEIPGLRVVALVPNLKGAERAYAAGADAIIVPVSASEAHSLANTGKPTAGQIAEVGRIVAWLRDQPRPMFVEAGCATAFGCSMEGDVPLDRVVAVCRGLAEAGAGAITLADTVGYGSPAAVKARVAAVTAEVGPLLTKLHLHDTLGLGLANAYAGLEAGIRHFDAALAGLGGCPFAPGASGNIVTEDLVNLVESMGFTTGIDLGRLVAARDLLAEGLPDEPLLGNVAKAGLHRRHAAA